MANRQSFSEPEIGNPELDRVIEEAKKRRVTDEDLREQAASFAFGNSPDDSSTTRESARKAAQSFRLSRT